MTPATPAKEAPAKRRRQHQERTPESRTLRELRGAAAQINTAEAHMARLKAKRDRLIVRRYQEGASFRAIADESGVSRPRVEQIVRAAGAINGHS